MAGKRLTTKMAAVALALGLTGTATAGCNTELFSDVAVKSDNVLLWKGKEMFRVTPDGKLFYAVHPVSLDASQQAALADYNKMVRTELPYISKSLSTAITSAWQSLDNVLKTELGEKSRLRGEVSQYHRYIQRKVNTSLYDEDLSPRLNHELLEQTAQEVRASLPQLVATVASKGLMDIAAQSGGEENPLSYISDRLLDVQGKVSDTIAEQRVKAAPVENDLCQRLTQWQQKEEKIQDLIPALASWKTVKVTPR